MAVRAGGGCALYAGDSCFVLLAAVPGRACARLLLLQVKSLLPEVLLQVLHINWVRLYESRFP